MLPTAAPVRAPAAVVRRVRRSAFWQVERHVRQVLNGTFGWFDGDVYQINSLSVSEKAELTVQSIGGRAVVEKMAMRAMADVGPANSR